MHHHPQCISCITFFVRIENNYRAYALKILSNLAKLGDRKILNDADTMTTVCDLITAPHLAKPLTDIEERYCINVICRLADDACNRAKVRKSGAFKHLLSVAKNTTNDSLLTMVTTLYEQPEKPTQSQPNHCISSVFLDFNGIATFPI